MMWIAEGLVALDDKAKIIFDTYLQTNKSFEQFAGKYGITDIYTDNNNIYLPLITSLILSIY